MNRMLWVVQGLLVLVFLVAGGSKLVSPSETLAAQFPPPPPLMRLVGLVEILGALGLVLPGLLRIRTSLTPLAAAGLAVVMVGAAAVTATDGSVAAAVLPLAVGVLAAGVAVGRRRIAPLQESPRRSVLRPAHRRQTARPRPASSA